MENDVTTKSCPRFMKYTFLLANGLVFLTLFWLVTSFIYRDPSNIGYWSAGGFVLGVLHGVLLQFLGERLLCLQRFSYKILASGILLLEFALGLLLIGPSIWLQLRFFPTSNLHSICCETPLEYGAVHYETIRLTSSDGATIAGWYVAPTTQAGKVIILIHGYGYDRRGTDFQTRALIAAGYGVLLYDLRNHGVSTGSLNSFNRMQTYKGDLSVVVNYLKQKPDVKQLGVVGISLGAFATLNLPATTLNSFSALWLDGLRFENFAAQLPLTGPLDYARYIFDQQARRLAAYYYGEPIAPPGLTFAQIVPQIQHPALMLVASGLDEVERRTNEKLIPLLGDKKSLWIIENAWHIGGRFDAPDAYREKMLAFFAGAFAD